MADNSTTTQLGDRFPILNLYQRLRCSVLILTENSLFYVRLIVFIMTKTPTLKSLFSYLNTMTFWSGLNGLLLCGGFLSLLSAGVYFYHMNVL